MPDGILGAIFGGAAAEVLEALLRGGDLTVRQVARVAGLSPSTASVALRRLEERGLVRGLPVGTAVQYRLNDEHFALPHLRALAAEGDEMRGNLPQLLESRLGSRPRCVILFGSMARGDARKDSDMDLLVVAHDEEELERWEVTGRDLAEWLTARIGGPLDVVTVAAPSPTDLRRPFWRNVLRERPGARGRTVGMNPRPVRVRPASRDQAVRAAAKARKLLEGARRAEAAGDRALAMIGYCHAGIHASDALCILATGSMARDADHAQAIGLLRQAPSGQQVTTHLERVLRVKRRWSYGIEEIGTAELRGLARAAEALVAEATARM